MERILPESTEWHGVPYVGCAVTIPVGSDSYPGTVVWVSDKTIRHQYKDKDGEIVFVNVPRRIKIRSVRSRGVKGHDNSFTEDQRYVYYESSEDETVSGTEYSYREKWKKYVAVGTSSRSSAAQSPWFGYRRYYRDPCF
jgi:hypothetical protein